MGGALRPSPREISLDNPIFFLWKSRIVVLIKAGFAKAKRMTFPASRKDLLKRKSVFMPELVLHKWLYGTFQMFVGDIKIYRVVD